MQTLYAIQDYIDQGGPVLWIIFVTCLLLWTLILERLVFMRVVWPRRANRLVAEWDSRPDCRSWRARKIRESVISQASMDLHALLPLIGMLVALCPLLGLVVAIPLLFSHAIIAYLSRSLIQRLDEQCAGVLARHADSQTGR